LSNPTATEAKAFDCTLTWGMAAMRMAADMATAGVRATEKGAAFDVVTLADGAIESFLRSKVRDSFPDHGFLGEEEGGPKGLHPWQWVVDPIDGTLNYATGLAGAACSIALCRDASPVVGAIADFSANRIYRARAGTGVILRHDGTAEVECRPSPTTIGSARVFIELGWEDLDPVMVGTIQGLAKGRPRVLRIVGGAAYALLNVALRGGCMLGIGLRIWDVAAGVVIAREAGLEVKLWEEQTASVHVIAGSADDVRELTPIVEELGASRVAATYSGPP